MVWKRFRETEEKGAAAAAAAAAPANFILARACSAAEQPVAEPDSLRNAHALARARARDPKIHARCAACLPGGVEEGDG